MRGRLRLRRIPFSAGLTVQGWLNLVLSIMAVLICAGAVAGAVSLTRSSQVTDELTGTLLPARAAAYQFQSSLLNQETGVRGYALTGDPSFLEPYNQGLQTQQLSTGQLRRLIGDRPDLLSDLTAIEQAADRWRTDFAVPLLAQATNAPGRIDPAVFDRGKTDFDTLRVLFTAQNQHIERARIDAHDRLSSVTLLRNIVFAAMFGVLLAVGAVFAALIRTAVTRPLRRLSDSSRLVAQGDFAHQVDAGRGPTDIRALAEDIEGMRRRIVTELEMVRDRQARLEEQTTALDAQTVELRRSNAELEQFAYVASHDLQEPLRKVASFCQLLEKRYGGSLDERGHQYIDFAVDGAKRMQALINDLLTFSRVGRVGDGFSRLPLDQPLDKALGNLAAAVEDSDAHITKPQQLPEITGDATLLTMLWQNLIGNAIKFARPDCAPEVSITADLRSSDEWLICVQDNGIGIPEEFTDKVFIIFQRLHARDAYSGTGIGLALCKKIVEYHGGKIWLDTTYTAGARFCLTLPSIAEHNPDTDSDADDTQQGALA
ncbi:CHASE3 domain-containing protein [Corynebacteriales bacterium D3-21]|uniref:histidine kinase n=1 Tax=Speluncibacter jeojiensis TaxID=2710754 RepID=A0A9X4LX14_9ACTN|nr:CHASE3 domain-containing protein [Corynebacteriales bacterium D3-21]